MKHEDEFVRSSAVRAIGAIGGERAVSVLTEALRDEGSSVRRSAAEALGEIGPAAAPAIPQLTDTMRNGRFLAPDAAAEAIGKIDPAALQRIADSDADQPTRDRARRVLQRIEQSRTSAPR